MGYTWYLWLVWLGWQFWFIIWIDYTPDEMVITSDYELLKTGNSSSNEIKYMKFAISSKILGPVKSAYRVDIENSKNPPISVGCRKLDEFLNGGLKRGSITEIYGESGSGKTQIALQVICNAWDTGAVYLSTEDVFPSKRLNQIASTLNNTNLSCAKFGDKIFVLQILEVDDLIKCIQTQLERLLLMHPDISVVVLDSIAAPFRGNYDTNSYVTRSQHLKSIGINLIKCAKEHNLAVLCINQVSSNFNSNEASSVVPCLGLVWSNIVTDRLRVSKTDLYTDTISDAVVEDGKTMINIKKMEVIHSSELISGSSHDYIITSKGVCGY